MILETLTLKNFGLYGGEQTIDLAPVRRNGQLKPIILIGGINGGGKTTIFDAVQLALYGSRGNYSKRSNMAYDTFLQESIHRGVSATTGASVGLTFRITSEGTEQHYDVRRTWVQKNRVLREQLYVYKDGELDQGLAEHWVDLIEEVIPLGVSQLFFFDAEKVRFLADDESGNKAIGSAVKSLLGLDLAERLISDAAVIESRLADRLPTTQEDSKTKELIDSINAKADEIRKKKEERASLENWRLKAAQKLTEAQDEFERTGGKHWKDREKREKKLVELQSSEVYLKDQLIRLASGALPMMLVSDLIQSIFKQSRREAEEHEEEVIRDVLTKRDRVLVRQLRQEKINEETIETIKGLLKTDRDSRRKSEQEDNQHKLSLSHQAQQSLFVLIDGGFDQLSAQLLEGVEKLDGCVREREQVQRLLKQTPDDSDISSIVEHLNSMTKESAIMNERAQRLDQEIETLENQHSVLERNIQQIRRTTVDEQIQSEEAARMAQLAIRTQETMKKYLLRATSDKIDRLSNFITESFRFLLRKKTLVERVQVDPETFHITLFDLDGNSIPKQRLSEGEKQLFAISVLWGLAQASPRPLPAIIDTPMARLDAEHRKHLIDRYFPNASHQVIILSTDTEVDNNFYTALEPKLSRAYHLNYNDKQKVTVAEEGYFWEAESFTGAEK